MKQKENESSLPKLKIAFVHPDLGIGGAERLVVDAAVGLQEQGHEVVIYTSHCDKNHCFEEVKSAQLKVEVLGDFLPTSLGGKFYIFFANLRQMYLTSKLMITGKIHNHDLYIVDQLSTCVPFLSAFSVRSRVLFYCHFPDQLLAQRSTLMKKLYRVPFDLLEQITMNAADCLVVNSNFTKSVYKKTFTLFSQNPSVVYPCVGLEAEDILQADLELYRMLIPQGSRFYLSINRYERKKNIELAVRSFAMSSESQHNDAKLVIAGGYDERVAENSQYLTELEKLAKSLNLPYHTFHYPRMRENSSELDLSVSKAKVLFLTSVSSSLKDKLMQETELLLYTPSFEHFGIVPLEAMKVGKPVLAVNNGGPLETVVTLTPGLNESTSTGWLRPSDPREWAVAIEESLVYLKTEKTIFQSNGPQRVKALFSRTAMTEQLEHNIEKIPWSSPKSPLLWLALYSLFLLSIMTPASLILGIDSPYYYLLCLILSTISRSFLSYLCILVVFMIVRLFNRC